MQGVSAITKNRTLVDKWLRHEFNEGSGYLAGNFSVGFFVAEEYYAAFRADLEAEFDSVSLNQTVFIGDDLVLILRRYLQVLFCHSSSFLLVLERCIRWAQNDVRD